MNFPGGFNIKMADEEKSFRQLEDVGCPSDIHAMKWSPKMDVIAIVTKEGDVWLNRLSWQRVWSIRSNDQRVVCLSWRPDGKVLALGLDSGSIKLVNVENSDCLHQYDVGSRPLFLEWVETRKPESSNLSENSRIFTEKVETFLPHLPNLPSGGSTVFSQEKCSETPWDPKRLKDLTGTLSFLVVSDQHCMVTLLVHGMLPVARVDIQSCFDSHVHCRVLDAFIEANINFICVVVETSTTSDFTNSSVTMLTFNTTLLRSRAHELEVLALKYGRISSVMTYFEGTFQAMSEAWENILIEIDSRLDKYAASLSPETSVSEEFLMLFTCGTASPELQAFLIHDLTEKGLKKLGKTVETSYSNIQTLALKNLQSASSTLLYHLNDLQGMAQWYERFGILGLSDNMVEQCLKLLGSLIMKTQELCSVIDNALRSFTAFFKWLYYVILQLLEEDIPAFVKKFNQEDVTLIATFLQCHLARGGSKSKSRFSMERVGQYLEKEPLTFQINQSENVWQKFLTEYPELKDVSFIANVSKDKSLATLHDELKSQLTATFERLTEATGQTISCETRVPLFAKGVAIKVVQYSSETSKQHWVAASKRDGTLLYMLRLKCSHGNIIIEGVSVNFPESEETTCDLRVIDVAFYDDTTLTLVLRRGEQDNTSDILVQFDLNYLDDFMFQQIYSKHGAENYGALDAICVNGNDGMRECRDLARMKASQLAVSGSRKVGSVLSTTLTRVKLFDMDAEEDLEQSLDDTHASIISTDSGN